MCAEDDAQHQCSVWMLFWLVCAHFGHRTAPVSIEINRAILRAIWRDFAQNMRASTTNDL